MALLKISADELSKARKSGFRKKAPKKPKRSSSLASLENFVARHNNWVKEAKAKSQSAQKKVSLLKMIYSL